MTTQPKDPKNIVSRVPSMAPVLNQDGRMSRAWNNFFRDLWKRTSDKTGNAIDNSQEGVDELAERVAQNEEDISQNQDDIRQNEIDIASNEGRIVENELDILDNQIAIADHELRISDLEDEFETKVQMDWVEGGWQDIVGGYSKGSTLRDGAWVMTALIDGATDRAAPQAIGPNIYAYQGGGLTPNSTLSKEVSVGIEVNNPDNPYWLTGYAIRDAVAGDQYQVVEVIDPGGSNEVVPIETITASAAGDIERTLVPRPVPAGTKVRLIALITKPSPPASTVLANYDYQYQQDVVAPLTGQITQAFKDVDKLLIHKTDNDGTDRSALLAGLLIGDTITITNTTWTIQAKQDNGSYWAMVISPAQTATELGVVQVSFNTTTTTTIGYAEDVGYWTGNTNLRGLFSATGGWEGVSEDDNQYNLDVRVQEAFVSDQWDVVSYNSEFIGV